MQYGIIIVAPIPCRRGEMVHAVDSKSTGGNTLGVRVPPPAPVKPVAKLQFRRQLCSDFAEHESSESSHSETFSLLKSKSEVHAPGFALIKSFKDRGLQVGICKANSIFCALARECCLGREIRLYRQTGQTARSALLLYKGNRRAGDQRARCRDFLRKNAKICAECTKFDR